jgi:hypothetical protein
VELEFGAIAERLEPQNLKPLQFEQRELLRKSGQRLVASGESFDLASACQMLAHACLLTGFLSSIRCMLGSLPDHFGSTFSPRAGQGGHKVKLL